MPLFAAVMALAAHRCLPFSLQRYSSAFAFGLLEAGFKTGDKMVLYVDQTQTAESLVAQLGAVKAGVSIVMFDEKESEEALDHALRTSQAKALLISPQTEVGEGATRLSFLQSLMPELKTMYAGEEMQLAKYPHLKHVVQTGHTAMRGINKFRDVAVYANPALSSRQIPTNSADAVTHVAYKDGREACTLTSGDLVQKAQSIWDSALASSKPTVEDKEPIFMACDPESPLGFTTFLAAATNMKKVFIPGTFNMTTMLQSVPRQASSLVVCDADLYSLAVPPAKKAEYQEMCSVVKSVLVAGPASSSSDLFPTAKTTALDKYSF